MNPANSYSHLKDSNTSSVWNWHMLGATEWSFREIHDNIIRQQIRKLVYFHPGVGHCFWNETVDNAPMEHFWWPNHPIRTLTTLDRMRWDLGIAFVLLYWINQRMNHSFAQRLQSLKIKSRKLEATTYVIDVRGNKCPF